MSDSATTDSDRLAHVTLDESRVVRRTPGLAREREQAVSDLVLENHFALRNTASGPYVAHIALIDGRMVFKVSPANDGEMLSLFSVPVGGDLRRIVRDYHALCRSHGKAIPHAPASRIEAIDMGRRSVHNEGAEILAERMEKQVRIDRGTSRRLFTVLSVMLLSNDPEFLP